MSELEKVLKFFESNKIAYKEDGNSNRLYVVERCVFCEQWECLFIARVTIIYKCLWCGKKGKLEHFIPEYKKDKIKKLLKLT